MNEVIGWIENLFAALPLPLLEVWGRFSFLLGSALAIYAFCGFTFRQGANWGWGRERQAWDARAFLSMPLTFILIIATGYVGSYIVLVPGAQTFESLKDLVVFLCIVLFGYPALITVPFAYGLSDLIEGVPPEFLLNWLPGYFINPACFWIAYQVIGKDPDFRQIRTWAGYLLFVLIFMILEPVLWGYMCSGEFTSAISYRSITPALFFTTGITWILAPFAMLGALPLTRRLGLFWAEIPGHVKERALWREAWTWASGKEDSQQMAATKLGWPIRMVLLLPFIALVLVMVGSTAFVILQGSEDHERMLATQLDLEVSENIALRLDAYLEKTRELERSESERGIAALLRDLPISEFGRALVIHRSGRVIASSADSTDTVADSAMARLRHAPGGLDELKTPLQFSFDHLTAKPLSKEPWFARATAYQDAHGAQTDWILITAIPEAFYLAGVRSGNSRSAMVFALALLLSLALVAVLASLVTEPIRRLSRASAALAGGDLSQRVPGSRLQELGDLAESFTNMAARLKNSFDDVMNQMEERKQRERQLQESENRLQLAVKAGKFGIWDWDVRNDKLIWDDSMYHLYGARRDEFDGTCDSWLKRLVPEDLEKADGALKAALRGEREFASDFRVRWPDGTVHFIRGVAQTIRGEDGHATRVVGINWDITEKMASEQEHARLEAQFRQAQKMEAFGQLAGGVAHDFNNLLTVILGYADLLQSALPAGSPEREKTRQIILSCERASSLTRQLLAFSRKTVLEPKLLDPNSVIKDLGKVLRRLIGEDIELTLSLGTGTGSILADPALLEQALINLAINARDAMPSGGKIVIETKRVELDSDLLSGRADTRPGPYVHIAVTDTGVGMDEDMKVRIFEPFFTTKGPGKGTGLGLAMVYGFVKQSGGQVSVHSAPGKGACFKLCLPCVDAPAPASEAKHLSDDWPKGQETILLVEDEDPVRTLARENLTACGYRVLEARDGNEALRVAASYRDPIHLLVTDVVMPNLGGRQLADALGNSHPETKVLYLSGYTNDAIVRLGILESSLSFLQKPFRPSELARKVREVLDGKRV